MAQNAVVQTFAIHIFHDEVVDFSGLAHVKGAHDILVVQFGGGATFLIKALDKLWIARHFLRKNFNGDQAVKRKLLGEKYGGHGAGSQFFHHLIARNSLSWALAFQFALHPRVLPARDDFFLNQDVAQAATGWKAL